MLFFPHCTPNDLLINPSLCCFIIKVPAGPELAPLRTQVEPAVAGLSFLFIFWRAVTLFNERCQSRAPPTLHNPGCNNLCRLWGVKRDELINPRVPFSSLLQPAPSSSLLASVSGPQSLITICFAILRNNSLSLVVSYTRNCITELCLNSRTKSIPSASIYPAHLHLPLQPPLTLSIVNINPHPSLFRSAVY